VPQGVIELNHKPTRPLVVGLGEILWDLLPEGKQLGGAPANFAFHAGQFDTQSFVVSAIGRDPLGDAILAQLDSLQIPTEYLSIVDGPPTGTVSVELDDNGTPSYTIHQGVAWDEIPWSDELAALAARADCVGFGTLACRCGISRETILNFLRSTRDDCLRIFDINLRQHFYDTVTIRDGLELARVLKLNDEELPIVVAAVGLAEPDGPMGTYQEVGQTLCREFDLDMIVLTCGASGAMRISRDDIAQYEGQLVDVADTVGAGDSFTATIAAGLLAGIDPDTVFRHAIRVAAHVCTQAGATPNLPESLRTFD
jgi:fructokinase